ncbi:MAG: hypothetical protein J5721_00345 [Lachnospiraceae bacterium]|nr:hypothetical protein [Lachnospiraceae bacterium]
MIEKKVTTEDGKVIKETRRGINSGDVVKGGVTFGSCLAMILSYVKWNSILWAILHGILSWAYVIYFAIKYGLQ